MILLLSLLLQERPLAEWIADLGHEDVDVRQRAEEHLVGKGASILPALRSADAGLDSERKARLEQVVSRIAWSGVWGRDLRKDLAPEELAFLAGYDLEQAFDAFPPVKQKDLERLAFPEADAVWSVLRKEAFAGARVVRRPDVPGRDPVHEGWIHGFAVQGKTAMLSHMKYFIRATKRVRGSDPILYLLQPRDETFDPSAAGEAALKAFAKPGWELAKKGEPGHASRTFSKDGAVTGAFHAFRLDGVGREPYPAYVFVKPRWALLVFH